MSDNSWANINIPESKYKYSDPITVREWSGGHGHITVKVGYVTEHPEKRQIVVEKVWPLGNQKFDNQKLNIKDPNDWNDICDAVNRLWPEIKDAQSSSDIKNAVNKVVKESKLLDLLAMYPQIVMNIPRDINLLTLPSDQKRAFQNLLTAGSTVAIEALKSLANEPIHDVKKLTEILENYNLSTVNSLVTLVTSRLSFIDTFEQLILSDEAYERRGNDSVHQQLRRNIWLLNRNYTVLHDDVTLKRIIWNEYQKEATGNNLNKRPDFLCMIRESDPDEILVLIEIKRPSVKLKFGMIDQINEYRSILKKHSGQKHKKFRAYLIGRELDDSLQDNPFKESGIIVKTYTDIIGEARRFYKEYRDIIDKDQATH